jgi:hypothetical protein
MIAPLERVDEKLYAITKPALQRIDHIQVNKHDVLILAAGFEDRAVGVLNRISALGQSGFNAIVVEYLPYIEENRSMEISGLLNRLKCHMQRITYNRQEPAGIGKQLTGLLKEVTGKIFIDISAMSRLMIVQLLVEIGRARLFPVTTILYCEAEVYPPSREEVEKIINKQGNDSFYRQLFLSSGIFEVCIVPGLSSVALQGQPIRLVTFPSFNIDQLAKLQAELQPYYINLIHGIPPRPENAWRCEALKRLNNIESIARREEKETSTLDYRETLDYLLEVYADHSVMERIVIAPIGSKMQTAAVGIFRTFMEDVQIVYPTPRKFSKPADYTKGIRDIHCLNLEMFKL